MANWYEDPIGLAIVKRKYLHEDENAFEDMVERISACFSEGLKYQIKSALLNADFFPAGRSLYALGCKGVTVFVERCKRTAILAGSCGELSTHAPLNL